MLTADHNKRIAPCPTSLFRSAACAVALALIFFCPEPNAATLNCRERPKNKKNIAALAGDLFSRGERAYAEGQHLKALKRFLCSMYTFEHEATLTNIREIVKTIDVKQAAADLLDEYVALNPDGKMTFQVVEIAEVLKTDLDADSEEKETPPEAPAPPAAPPPPEKVCVAVADTAPFILHAENQNRLFKLLGAAALGVGSAVMVTGAVFEGLSIGAANDGDIAKQNQFQTGAIVGFVAGALTVGLGAAQFVLALKQAKQLDGLKSNPHLIEKCALYQTDKPKIEAAFSAGPGAASLTLKF